MLRTVNAVADSVEHTLPVRKVGSAIDVTCHYLTWWSALIGLDKDSLAQCQDKVAQWDIRQWCWQLHFVVVQHYKVAMNPHCHK